MSSKRNAGIRCPGCFTMMYRVPTEGPEIDVCRGCQMMWFDAGELEEMPRRSSSEISAEADAEARDRERREWRRRLESQEEFLLWLRRHPVGFIAL